ncbi:MAG: hypothetical protein JNL02_17660 [Saprospiraceae bacterium]|nr:hypothetical protein [Saprospiraceae bacterium]
MFSPDDLIFLSPENSLPEHIEGSFARRVMVILSSDENLPDNRAFLTKVLAAAQLNLLQDCLLVEVPASGSIALSGILKVKQPTQVLVFGISPEQLGFRIQVNLYQPFHFQHTSFLFAEKLGLVEPDKNRKGQLWRALQTLFL